MAYFGCGTRANKVLWGIVAFAWFAGAVLLITGLAGGTTGENCFQLYSDCTSAGFSASDCASAANDYCKYWTWAALCITGGLFILIGLVSMIYFCLASPPPESGGKPGTVAVTGHHTTTMAMGPGGTPQPPPLNPAPPTYATYAV